MTGAFLMNVSCSRGVRPAASTPAGVASRATSGPTPDGESVAAALRASTLPVVDVLVLTPESDPDKLLGRPNQYTDRVSWQDARASGDASLEIFSNLASLQARKLLLESRNVQDGRPHEYIYDRPERRMLLRIPRTLTPEQAREYETWF